MSKLNAKNEIEMKKIIEENDTSHSFIATEINLRDEDIDFDLHDTIMNDSRTHSMVGKGIEIEKEKSSNVIVPAISNSKVIPNNEESFNKRKGSIVKTALDVLANRKSTYRADEDDIIYDDDQEVKLTTENNKLQQAKKPWYIIHPQSRRKSLWDFLIHLILIYAILTIPFRLAFVQNDQYGPADIVIDCLFALDMAFTFFTGVYINGNMNYSLCFIAMFYLKGWFAIDLCATVPVSLMIPQDSSSSNTTMSGTSNINNLNSDFRLGRLPRLIKVTRMLRFLRVLRLAKLDYYMNENLENRLVLRNHTIRFLKFIVWVIVILHFISCLWFLVTVLDDFSPNSWVFRRFCTYLKLQYPCADVFNCTDAEVTVWQGFCSDFAFSNTLTMYLDGIYFGFTTMATIGYGDINAFTNTERITCILIMITAASFYSFTISSLSSILTATEADSRALQTKLSHLLQLTQFHHLPKDLYLKIHKHFKYEKEGRRGGLTIQQEDEIMDSLTNQLRTEVLLNIHKAVIMQIRLLREEDKEFAARVAARLQPILVERDAYIFRENDHAAEIFFIASGIADMYSKKVIVASINEGGYVGNQTLYRQSHSFSCKARVDCQLYAWSRADMQVVFEDFPLIYEKLTTIAKSRVEKFKENFAKINNQKRRKNITNIATNSNGSFLEITDNDKLQENTIKEKGKLTPISPSSDKDEANSQSVKKPLSYQPSAQNVFLATTPSAQRRPSMIFSDDEADDDNKSPKSSPNKDRTRTASLRTLSANSSYDPKSSSVNKELLRLMDVMLKRMSNFEEQFDSQNRMLLALANKVDVLQNIEIYGKNTVHNVMNEKNQKKVKKDDEDDEDIDREDVIPVEEEDSLMVEMHDKHHHQLKRSDSNDRNVYRKDVL